MRCRWPLGVALIGLPVWERRSRNRALSVSTRTYEAARVENDDIDHDGALGLCPGPIGS